MLIASGCGDIGSHPPNMLEQVKQVRWIPSWGEERISKIKIHKLARWVTDQYEKEGRMTAISDEELEAKTEELLPQYWEQYQGATV